jgi:peptidoglycan/LPS O-acetylase OafA/YrhL
MNFLERYPEFPGMKILAIPIALGAALAASAVFYRFIELPSHEFARKKIPFTKKPRTI